MERVEILKNTNDDWHPNFENNNCQLIYIGKLSDGKFRVAVWGNDDFGIDKDFETESEAIEMFHKLEKYETINHKDLYELKFTNFLKKINKDMDWIDVNDTTVEIPFTKVCIYDGGNTFWAYLEKIEITNGGRRLFWNIKTPEGYGDLTPTHWMKVTHPKQKH